jgi:hypothetical protein
LYWKHSLTAVDDFVTRDNVNQILADNGFVGEIGLLVIDIDGVDYWLWDAIDAVSPKIVICEYNGIFGNDATVTVPYDETFDRTSKHFSWLYAGASLQALRHLGQQKGYSLIGTNCGGNNAFFLRDDVLAGSSVALPENLYRRPMFREARNRDGSLAYVDVAEGIKWIEDLEVFDVEACELRKIRDLEIRLGD